MRLKKIKILILVPHYLPGYKAGGPIRSVANMVHSLGDEFNFKIITSDRDLYSQKPFSNISSNSWIKLTNTTVFYASPKFLSLKNMIKLFHNTDFDILYLNSFFHPVFGILPIFISKIKKIPVILAPRGEFSSGALSIKPIKKRIYIIFSNISRLYNHIYWQASSEIEKNDIKNVFKRSTEIFTAPNIPIKKESNNAKSNPLKKVGFLNVVFLSRISPKKNLDGALNILKNIKGTIVFDIFGPIGDESYWKNCQSIIDKIGSNILVRYKGSVNHETVNSVLRSYDLFFLPTHGENFGHVILEALSAGLPVIISDQTPWHDLSKFNAGIDIPIEDAEKYRQTINDFVQMSSDEYNKFRKGALSYANAYTNDSEIIQKNREMFLDTYSKS
jgi:glycosyltransferase involved in cell wall biosynthesis